MCFIFIILLFFFSGIIYYLFVFIDVPSTQFKKLWEIIVRDEKLIQHDDLWSIIAEGTEWSGGTTSLLVTSDWKNLAQLIMSQRERSNIVLNGKAGRGKSVFLLYLMFSILLRAKNKHLSDSGIRIQQSELDPSIVFVNLDGVIHYVTVDQVCIRDSIPDGAHYYFADNIDIKTAGLGSHITMALSSGDVDVLKEWHKRIKESEGLILYMPSLTLESMERLFGESSTIEEIVFKFDVINGNPREFHNNCKADLGSKYFVLVKECVKWMFGDDYISNQNSPSSSSSSSTGNALSVKQSLGLWAINIIVYALTNCDLTSSKTDSSLFKHYEINEEYTTPAETFTSTFMGYVAGKLSEKYEQEVSSTLKKLFGSGIGNAFEFTSHASLLAMTADQDHWSWCGSTSSYVNLKGLLGGHRKVLIRNIDDIKSLKKGDYGLPTVCNFPLIDSIILPSVVTNMTIGNTHHGAVGKVNEIVKCMKIEASRLMMVFVVPDDQVAVFKFPTDLGQMKMYVTVSHGITEAALQHLKSRKRIRLD